jgi:hypothetical protein
METYTYQDRFHEALQRAFAATNPAVRIAYFELAEFYSEKLGNAARLNSSSERMRRFLPPTRDAS